MEFQDVLRLKGDPLTFTPTVQHRIEVNPSQPIYIRQYKTLYKPQQEVARQVDDLVEDGLVQPSKNPIFLFSLCPSKLGRTERKRTASWWIFTD
jgi:hypothetical protein